jgi:hypothetical protein
MERLDPKDLATLISAPSSIQAGDTKSCPPDLELGAITQWLASRMLVCVSAGLATIYITYLLVDA